MIEIKNLSVFAGNIAILNDINLKIQPGEIHAIMGKNGSGKSTLAKTIMFDSMYNVSGDILFENDSILDDKSNIRSHKGIFLSNQNPVEINGLLYSNFLIKALNEKQKFLNEKMVDQKEFYIKFSEYIETLSLPKDFKSRYLNFNMSGGEKKKSEMIQWLFLQPKFSMFDELDSGVDVDALKRITNVLNEHKTKEKSYMIITHYNHILEYVKPDYVHVIENGKIKKSGDKSLSEFIVKNGFEYV